MHTGHKSHVRCPVVLAWLPGAHATHDASPLLPTEPAVPVGHCANTVFSFGTAPPDSFTHRNAVDAQAVGSSALSAIRARRSSRRCRHFAALPQLFIVRARSIRTANRALRAGNATRRRSVSACGIVAHQYKHCRSSTNQGCRACTKSAPKRLSTCRPRTTHSRSAPHSAALDPARETNYSAVRNDLGRLRTCEQLEQDEEPGKALAVPAWHDTQLPLPCTAAKVPAAPTQNSKSASEN